MNKRNLSQVDEHIAITHNLSDSIVSISEQFNKIFGKPYVIKVFNPYADQFNSNIQFDYRGNFVEEGLNPFDRMYSSFFHIVNNFFSSSFLRLPYNEGVFNWRKNDHETKHLTCNTRNAVVSYRVIDSKLIMNVIIENAGNVVDFCDFFHSISFLGKTLVSVFQIDQFSELSINIDKACVWNIHQNPKKLIYDCSMTEVWHLDFKSSSALERYKEMMTLCSKICEDLNEIFISGKTVQKQNEVDRLRGVHGNSILNRWMLLRIYYSYKHELLNKEMDHGSNLDWSIHLIWELAVKYNFDDYDYFVAALSWFEQKRNSDHRIYSKI